MKIIHNGIIYNSLSELKQNDNDTQEKQTDKQNMQPLIVSCLVYCLNSRLYTVKHY